MVNEMLSEDKAIWFRHKNSLIEMQKNLNIYDESLKKIDEINPKES